MGGLDAAGDLLEERGRGDLAAVVRTLGYLLARPVTAFGEAIEDAARELGEAGESDLVAEVLEAARAFLGTRDQWGVRRADPLDDLRAVQAATSGAEFRRQVLGDWEPNLPIILGPQRYRQVAAALGSGGRPASRESMERAGYVESERAEDPNERARDWPRGWSADRVVFDEPPRPGFRIIAGAAPAILGPMQEATLRQLQMETLDLIAEVDRETGRVLSVAPIRPPGEPVPR